MQKRRRTGVEGSDEEDGEENAEGQQQDDDGEDMDMEYEPTDPGSPIAGDNAETENLEKDAAKNEAEIVILDSMDNSELLCHPCDDIRTPMILKTPIMSTAKAVE